MPPDEPSFFVEHIGLLLLLSGAVVWYGATRILCAAASPLKPVHRAVALSSPVAGLVIALLLTSQPGAAVGLILSSSIACLSLVTGVILLTAPDQTHVSPVRSIWAFILPAALLVFLAGFRAQFTLLHALVFAAQGTVTLLLSTGRSQRSEAEQASPWHRPVLLSIAFGLVVLGAWLGATACRQLTQRFNLHTDGMVASVLLSPAIVLGMVGTGSIETQRGRFGDVFTSHVMFVLINLCVLLPILTVAWLVIHGTPIRMPLPLWRVDAVVLIVLGLMSLIMSTGRWTPGKLEGAGLVVLYGAYLLMSRLAHE